MAFTPMTPKPIDIPFAYHTPGWQRHNDPHMCYAVLDGGMISNRNDDYETKLVDALILSATEFMHAPAWFVSGIWAADMFCGSVLVVYFEVHSDYDKTSGTPN